LQVHRYTVQHITDNMLKMMKRSHDRKETIAILNKLRNEIPGVVIRTTLIAGHPGETEQDFIDLKDFISGFRFDRLGVFAYSHEEDTYSYKEYKDEISEEIKESRVAELMEIQQNISAELNESAVGQTFKVIIDRKEGEFFIGRTEFDSPRLTRKCLSDLNINLFPVISTIFSSQNQLSLICTGSR